MYSRYLSSLKTKMNDDVKQTVAAEDYIDQRELAEQVPQETKNKWEREQAQLKKLLVVEDSPEITKIMSASNHENLSESFFIGGVDISFVKGDNLNACAALIVVDFPELKVVYEDCQMIKLTAPYIPGFLAFREAYLLVDMYNKLKASQPQFIPQVIMVDGNGLLHPREFGLACHLGVLLNLPCIGVAKKLFQVDGLEKNKDHHLKIEQLTKGGDVFPLVGTTGKILGKALRSCDSSSNPIYISIGHQITLDSAVELVYRCCKHRVPEPTRQADVRSREYLRLNFNCSNGQPTNKSQKKEKTKTRQTNHHDAKKVVRSDNNAEDLLESTYSLFDEDNR